MTANKFNLKSNNTKILIVCLQSALAQMNTFMLSINGCIKTLLCLSGLQRFFAVPFSTSVQPSQTCTALIQNMHLLYYLCSEKFIGNSIALCNPSLQVNAKFIAWWERKLSITVHLNCEIHSPISYCGSTQDLKTNLKTLLTYSQ